MSKGSVQDRSWYAHITMALEITFAEASAWFDNPKQREAARTTKRLST